jgi:imidazole glycerol-phosphate synthase subunit HisH
MDIRVGVIDCGISNITSVLNAFLYLGCNVKTVSKSKEVSDFTHLVLPGVGSFPKGMENLIIKGFDEAISNEVEKGKPILGLCLGMQLFAEFGEEFEPTNGLRLIEGHISKIDTGESRLRLPHIGWNKVTFKNNSVIAAGVPESSAFYFVHSYSYSNPNEPYVVGICDYSTEVVAFIEKDNIFGAQFHPEKSQANGLLLLKNFTKVSG